MKISRTSRRTHSQLSLFDTRLRGHGSARYASGEFYENLTASVFGGVRHVCDSRMDYCPDVSIGEHIFLECKSVRRGSTVLIYEGRLHKDWKFALTNHLFYVVWCHDVRRACDFETVEDLHAALLLKTLWCAVIPFDEIWRLCSIHKRKVINTRYGKSSNSGLYGAGYTIPVKCVEPWRLLDWHVDASIDLQMPRTIVSR